MFTVRRHREPAPGESRTVRIEGREVGSPVSIFVVDAEPGRGPDLHVHPYAETWIVRKGEAEFTVGEATTRAAAGDVLVGPPNVPHRFRNVGTGRLEMVCVHPAERVEQVFVQTRAAQQGEAACPG